MCLIPSCVYQKSPQGQSSEQTTNTPPSFTSHSVSRFPSFTHLFYMQIYSTLTLSASECTAYYTIKSFIEKGKRRSVIISWQTACERCVYRVPRLSPVMWLSVLLKLQEKHLKKSLQRKNTVWKRNPVWTLILKRPFEGVFLCRRVWSDDSPADLSQRHLLTLTQSNIYHINQSVLSLMSTRDVTLQPLWFVFQFDISASFFPFFHLCSLQRINSLLCKLYWPLQSILMLNRCYSPTWGPVCVFYTARLVY